MLLSLSVQVMLSDCRVEKIDMVITESMRRFARNTLITLQAMRELKALGIDCYFEDEPTHSMSGRGELLPTPLASYAQEESLSVSENCKRKIRHGFQDGKLTCVSPFGYRMLKGKLVVVPEEAEIVKTIFALFLSGLGKNAIVDMLDSKGELLITPMSSLAQEESRSISQNTTRGQHKRFSDGKVTMPFRHFLGCDRGEDGKPIVNEKEAKTVRLIYKLCLDGKSTSAIARYLMRQGVPTPGGCDTWQTAAIDSILTNEKRRGDALLQKSFTVDFLTRKMKKNEREAQQYYDRWASRVSSFRWSSLRAFGRKSVGARSSIWPRLPRSTPSSTRRL